MAADHTQPSSSDDSIGQISSATESIYGDILAGKTRAELALHHPLLTGRPSSDTANS